MRGKSWTPIHLLEANAIYVHCSCILQLTIPRNRNETVDEIMFKVSKMNDVINYSRVGQRPLAYRFSYNNSNSYFFRI